jgi:hypothetical protein
VTSRPHLAWLALLTLASGCSFEEVPPPQPPPRPPPIPVLPIAAPRPVASSIGFELVHTPEGAVLAWGAPARLGGGVRALGLDPRGAPRGTEVEVARGLAPRADGRDATPVQIEELALASSGGRLGMAWVVGGPAPEVQATFSARETEGLAPPRTLGSTTPLVPGSRPSRGRVAVTTREDGGLVVSYRVEDAPCSAAAGAQVVGTTCGRLAHTELDGIAGAAEGGPAMEVPSPCAALVPGAVTTGGTWFYGLCHLAPAPVTTVYAIRPSISYAAANDALEGCLPEGIAPLPEGAALVASCAASRSAAFLDGHGRVASTATSLGSEVTCEEGRPVIVLRGEAAARRVPLIGAVSRLETLLPERVAPRASRASWTGEALLVAAWLEGEVALRRYECREGTLVRTDLP